MLSLFINWDISPEIFNLGGISIRYYGLLFAVAFILGYKVEEKMFKSEGLPMAWLDKLWLYLIIYQFHLLLLFYNLYDKQGQILLLLNLLMVLLKVIVLHFFQIL